MRRIVKLINQKKIAFLVKHQSVKEKKFYNQLFSTVLSYVAGKSLVGFTTQTPRYIPSSATRPGPPTAGKPPTAAQTRTGQAGEEAPFTCKYISLWRFVNKSLKVLTNWEKKLFTVFKTDEAS